MAGYDVLGNIAIVKFDRKAKATEKKKFAVKLMKQNKGIRTVLEKVGKFSGRLRTLDTKYVAGEKTKEALYRENGCEFRFNVDTCYFSPRLSSERSEIAKMVKKGEKILVMCGGIAPYAIVISKLAKPSKVVSVELGRDCNKYAFVNVKRNKLVGKVEIIQGDVRKVCPALKRKGEKYDRIVMGRPNLKDPFLDVAFPLIRKGGMIHYYGFYDESAVSELRDLIFDEARKTKKKIKLVRIKKAGDIGIKKFRYRADFVVN